MGLELKKRIPTILAFVLHKYPLINALSLLMLLAERAPNEKYPPIHHRLIYVNVIGFLACGLLMSSYIKRKEAAMIYAGQLFYFAYTYYNNPKLQYKEWVRIQMAARHIGCGGIYIMLAFIVDGKKSTIIGRCAEVVIGLYMFATTYLINNTREVRSAVLSHILAGDWGRYVLTVVIAACALSFFSGYFLRDMSVCAAVAILFLTCMVDADFNYWSRKGIHFWNQARMVGDNLCICTGLFFCYFKLSNRLKVH